MTEIANDCKPSLDVVPPTSSSSVASLTTDWKRDAFWTTVQRFASIGVSAAVMILLARLLGKAGLGSYQLAILVPAMGARLLDMGLSTSHVYFVGSNRVSVHAALKLTVFYTIFVSLLAVPLLAIALPAIAPSWFPGISTTLLIVGVASFPVLLLEPILRSLLRATRMFKAYNITSIAAPIIFASSLLVALAIGLSPVIALTCYVLAEYMRLALTAYLVIRRDAEFESRGQDLEEAYAKNAFSYGWKVHVAIFSMFLSYRVDIFLLNFFLGPAATGIYVVAVQLAERLGNISQAVQTVVLPRLSAMSEAELREFTPVVNRWTSGITILTAAALIAVAQPLITLFFGSEYDEAYRALLALMPGIIALASVRVLANDLSGRGLLAANCLSALAGVVLNIAFNLLFIPWMGIVGAAIASSISYSVTGLILLVAYVNVSDVHWKCLIVAK